MSNPYLAPLLSTEAQAAGAYPANRFNQRERKLLQSVEQGYPQSVVAAGSFSTVAGSASQTIPVTGALSTDVALVVLKTAGAVPRTVLTSAAASGQINVVMSGDPSTDHVLSWILIRAR